MVVDPQMCGIGGFGAATVRTADGTEICIDFNGTAGSKATPAMWQDIVIEQDWTGYGYHLKGQVNDIGYGSIMTPGTVAGMAELLERFGTISWQDALRDAIRISDEGYVVTPGSSGGCGIRRAMVCTSRSASAFARLRRQARSTRRRTAPATFQASG